MRVVVVTGGLGSGKSTAAKRFADKGAVVVDLDRVALDLMTPDSMLLARVAEAFGPDDVLLADGRLDRSGLARVAFSSPERTRQLDGIVHPAVERHLERILDELRGCAEPPDIAVVEIPLLAEAPQLVRFADVVLAIVAPEAIRVERARARGMAREDAERRIRIQAPDATRAELADVVIVNSESLSQFEAQLDAFWKDLAEASGGER